MNMYIGNLSYNVRESDLRQVMEEYGTVESVKLIMDRNTNRSKGFAFVEMVPGRKFCGSGGFADAGGAYQGDDVRAAGIVV